MFRRIAGTALTFVYPALVLAALRLWGDRLPGGAAFLLKLYPVAVSLTLLATFGNSLRAGRQPVVERLARLKDPDLPPRAVAYTRVVTKAWMAFFVFNASLSLASALWMSHEAWALYNGVIAYALMGLFFGVELLFRRRVQHAKS